MTTHAEKLAMAEKICPHERTAGYVTIEADKLRRAAALLRAPSREDELREALDEAKALFEGDPECSEPGSDAHVWLEKVRALAGTAPAQSGPRVMVADDGSFQIVERLDGAEQERK